MTRRTDLLIPAGALLSVVLFVIHPDVPSKGIALLELVRNDEGRWVLAHSLGFVDGILWAAGGWLLADRLAPYRRRTAAVVRVLLLVGSVAISSISTAELMFVKIVDGEGGHPTAAMGGQFNYGGTGLPVGALVVLNVAGVILAVVAFWRAGVLPGWTVPAVVIGSVLYWAPSDGLNHLVPAAGDLVRGALLVMLVRALNRPGLVAPRPRAAVAA